MKFADRVVCCFVIVVLQLCCMILVTCVIELSSNNVSNYLHQYYSLYNLYLTANDYDKNDCEVHLLLISDSEDMLALYTLVNSIIINEKQIERLNFHILIQGNKSTFSNEFTKYFQQYLNKIKYEFKSIEDSIECVEYHKIIQEYYPTKLRKGEGRLKNIMNVARFCIPNIFTNVQIGIYLDVDMIVQSSISILYDEYYYKHNLIAWSVKNRKIRAFQRANVSAFLKEYFKNMSDIYPSVSNAVEVHLIHRTFNAGMLMYHLGIWRKYNFTQQSIELWKINKISPFTLHLGGVTQPMINLLFIANGIEVGHLIGWNLNIKDVIGPGKPCSKELKFDDIQMLNNANSIHWSGPCKPWIKNQNHSTSNWWIKYVPVTN
eukprot:286709_1